MNTGTHTENTALMSRASVEAAKGCKRVKRKRGEGEEKTEGPKPLGRSHQKDCVEL